MEVADDTGCLQSIHNWHANVRENQSIPNAKFQSHLDTSDGFCTIHGKINYVVYVLVNEAGLDQAVHTQDRDMFVIDNQDSVSILQEEVNLIVNAPFDQGKCVVSLLFLYIEILSWIFFLVGLFICELHRRGL